MERSNHNGTLTLKDINKEVTLVGWVHKKRNLGALMFIDLRDRSGIVQITIREGLKVPDIRNEYVIWVKGKVAKKDVPNKQLKTGEIEVIASEIKVINKAETTPIIIDDNTDALEDTRLKYRYLDLRRPINQKRLQIRANVVKATHEYLDNLDFLEVETPILTLSTPEGARDYLVPSRIHKGCFYALPQSPQMYKQLLMIGGCERYYQIAKCFRDEDLRADRQPDFTQIDIETSFLDQDQVLTIMEGLIAHIFKKVINYDIKLPLRRMKYDDAVRDYGSDKPETRFDMKIKDIKDIVNSSEFGVFKDNQFVRALVVNGVAKTTTRKVIDKLQLEAKKFSLKGYIVLKYENNKLDGSVTKYLNEEIQNNLIKELKLKNDDIVIIAASNSYRDASFGLGAVRVNYGSELKLIPPHTHDALYIVDFPLFEISKETGKLTSCHHPFTRPKDEEADLLDKDPSKVHASAYDMVIDGNEAGGGSLRIYDPEMQKKVFRILGLTDEDIKRKFGFFIDAFKYGTPPHGGIAFGLERIVMMLSETNNIRDVIAFPKNLSAMCPMSNSPREVDQDQLDELGIEIKKEKK